jgi:hypothetical protein
MKKFAGSDHEFKENGEEFLLFLDFKFRIMIQNIRHGRASVQNRPIKLSAKRLTAAKITKLAIYCTDDFRAH